jgi:predicted unusual protein kinase regulating ubiquinone biosynthesis (AarF/ABC1/UbiB family)
VFGDNKMVTAPEVYWDYCGPHMICMERVYGVPMDDFDAHDRMGFDAQANLRRGMKAWIEAMAIHGPFHGDLHAGNIWALEDGRACFLDFGIMGEFGPEWQQMVKDILYTFMLDHDFVRVVRGYKRLGIISGDLGDDESLAALLHSVFEPIMNTRMEDLQFADLFMQSLELAEQMGDISAPQELSLLGKQFLYFERYVKGISPDYLMVLDPYLIKNIFPEEAAAKMDELRAADPAEPVDPDEHL